MFYALEKRIITYDQQIENRLIEKCSQWVKVHKKEDSGYWDSPLYAVLKMKEKDLLPSLKSFEQFAEQNYFFSFVCFPERFDYMYFEVKSWYTWLEYPAIQTAIKGEQRKVLKKKFEEAVLQGVTEDVLAIYYRYFYTKEDDSAIDNL